MAPTDRNPVQVQYYAKGKKTTESSGPAPAPLILIHDGGGTTFAYFTIGRLERDVWAIHSPTFTSAQPWEGGMDGMAKHYIELIEKVAGIKGKILLGGEVASLIVCCSWADLNHRMVTRRLRCSNHGTHDCFITSFLRDLH